MTETLITLISIAALAGLVHTLAGPDHYVPFVMMSKARDWSLKKTAAITALCGLGHVLGSIALGAIGIAAGFAITKIESVESARGTMAAWLMIGFGLVYAAWGLKRMWRNKPHSHNHVHEGGETHRHVHTHLGHHAHVHDEAKRNKSITPWVLFTIFVFGPCEVLIPLLMFPAAKESLFGIIVVTAVFGLVTIGTMLVLVLALSYGYRALRLGWLERSTHTVAGLTIALCGALILIGF